MKPYYQDDKCTIYHGDCREILSEIGFDLIITDPPYGTGCAPRGGKKAGTIDLTSGQIPEWDVLDNGWMNFANGKPMAVFCGIKKVFEVASAMNGDGLLVYAKSNPSPLGSSYEPCVTRGFGFCHGKQHKVSYNAFNGQVHPTQKPLDVMTWIVGLAPKGVVCDPFMGSGTTLRACKDVGVKCVGIEREEKYCEIAVQRLAQECLEL